ncbi:MAG: phenylacetic acid degradation operon negative regulatory protein PaaX [Acidimicrobiia bacterium]|nr:phenylacetic acid degradation operon negative regulatory protein PaaX [Acidimicrobiia bacterium]
MTNISAEAKKWGGLADTSARSVLVTILGDSVAPLGGEVWLSDLFVLAEPFGFNQRLVRTSMYRLVNENWVINERVGRRSRYRLTPYAALETADADRRIYQQKPPAWNEVWSLVFTGTLLSGDGDDERRLARHLRWHGFVEITRGVLATPESDPASTDELLERLDLEVRPPVALARFDRLDELVQGGLFRSSFHLAETEKVYQSFIDRYRRLGDLDPVAIEPVDAFALRTMIVHDLRRARLSDPHLPAALLPDGWVGAEAFDLAARIYRAVDDRAWSAVEQATDLEVANGDARLTLRFDDGV